MSGLKRAHPRVDDLLRRTDDPEGVPDGFDYGNGYMRGWEKRGEAIAREYALEPSEFTVLTEALRLAFPAGADLHFDDWADAATEVLGHLHAQGCYISPDDDE